MSDSLKFRLQITCDNHAFEDNAAPELARILRDLASRLERGENFDMYRNLFDLNGNIVGQCALKEV